MSHSLFKNRVRNRVCGLVVEAERILLAKIDVPTREQPVWMAPGGEIHFGERAEDALKREMREETGIEINVRSLRYLFQFIEPPYHSIEFYFDCQKTGGQLIKGKDPEVSEEEQLILEVDWIPLSSLRNIRIRPDFLAERFVSEWHNEISGPFFIRQ